MKRDDGFDEVLRAHGADINVCSTEGDSAFLTALPIAPTWQLEEWWPHADVNAPRHDGARPLHLAVASRRPDVVSWLRRQGADLSLCNARGETPLAYCRRLLSTTTDRVERAWLRDSEHALAAPISMWQEDILRTLLPELRAEGLEGEKADEIYKAALQQGNLSAVRRLLAAGANPNAALDTDDTPPLLMAYRSESPLGTTHEML